MARITWNQVAAPDYSAAIKGTAIAGDMFAKGMSGLGNVASDIRQRQKEAISAQAMADALQFTDASAFDKAMQQNPLLGYNPKDLTAEAMKYYQGLGTNLLNRDQTRQSMALALNQDARAADDNTRANETQGWNRYAQGRKVLGDERADATLAMQMTARAELDRLYQAGITPDQVQTEIAKGNYAPAMKDVMLGMYKTSGADMLRLNPSATLEQNPTSDAGQLTREITSLSEYVTNGEAIRNRGDINIGSISKIDQMIKENGTTEAAAAAYVKTLGLPEGSAANWLGTSLGFIQEIKADPKYSRLSDAVILDALINSPKPVGFWGGLLPGVSGGDLKIDDDAAKKKLDKFIGAGGMSKLEADQKINADYQARVSAINGRMLNLSGMYNYAASAGRNTDSIVAEMTKLRNEAQAIRDEYQKKFFPSTAVQTQTSAGSSAENLAQEAKLYWGDPLYGDNYDKLSRQANSALTMQAMDKADASTYKPDPNIRRSLGEDLNRMSGSDRVFAIELMKEIQNPSIAAARGNAPARPKGPDSLVYMWDQVFGKTYSPDGKKK